MSKSLLQFIGPVALIYLVGMALITVVEAGAQSPKPSSADTTFTGQKYEGPRCKSVPSPDGCNTCSECDGVLTSCTLAYCLKPHVESQTEEKPKPALVVPAIRSRPMKCEPHYICTGQPYWECTDKSRTLLHSEDGLKHWCVAFGELAGEKP